MGGLEQSVSESAEPAGQDRSGSLERLAGAPSRLRKRFALSEWQTPEATWLLRQRLWRLAQLELPELPGLMLAADGPACWLDDHRGPSLLESRPLDPKTLGDLLGCLAKLVWRAHQARVTGLRFCAEALARATTGWRWLAPDLVPAELHEEADRVADLEALALFAEDLLAAPPDEDTPLARAIAVLRSAQPQPTAALAQALELLEIEVPTQGLPADMPATHRQRELDDLALRLTMALEDECLQVATVVAPQAIGSRCFVRALAERFRGSGARLLSVSCRRPGEPMAAWAAIARRLLLARGAAPTLSLELSPLAELLPEYAGEPLPSLPPRLARLRLFRALRDLLLGSTDTPPCLVLTDFEAADELTRAFTSYLRGQSEGLPLLLCLVSAGDEPARGEEDTLLLAPLTPAQIEDLAQAWCLTKPMTAEALETAHRYSAGSPARLQRLCLRWLRNAPLDTLPAAMSEALHTLLASLACLGGEAELALLARASGTSEAELFTALEAALANGWLEQHGASIGFVLAREAREVADTLTNAPEWHKRLAACLSPVSRARAAHHALAGQDTALIAELALQTGVALLALGAYDWSAPLLQRGLELPSLDNQARAALSATLGTLYLEKGEPHQAQRVVQRALVTEPQARHLQLVAARIAVALEERATAEAIYRDFLATEDDELQMHGALGLSSLALARGNLSDSLAHAERALSLAHRRDAVVMQAEANWLIGGVLLRHGGDSLAQCFVYLGEAVRLAEECEHLDLSARASGALAEACARSGRLGDAQVAWHRHLELCVLLDRTDETLIAVVTLAGLMLQLGFFEAALAEVSGIESELIESGRLPLWAEAIAIRAAALAVLGYLNDPLRLLDQALRTARRLRDEALELRVLGYLAVVLTFLGRYGRAEEISHTALALADRLGDKGADWAHRLLVAEIRSHNGAWREAETMLQAVRQEAREQGASGIEASALRGLAGAMAAQGDWAQAERYGTEALDYAELNSHLLLQAELCRWLGLAAHARGEHEAAQLTLNAALSAADAMNSPHHRALAYSALCRYAPASDEARALRARAVENLDVYLEQLTEHGKRDFLQAPDRREILDPDRPAEAASVPSLLNLLQTDPESGVQTASFSVLDQVLGLLTEHLPLEDLLPRVNETFMRLSQASRGMIFLLNEDGELRLHDRQSAPDAVAMGAEACRAALDQVGDTARTLWVPDTLQEAAFDSLPEVRQHGLRGILCVPLKVPDGEGERVLGCLYGDRQAPWLGISDHEIALVEMMARYTSVMIEVGLLQAETQRKTHRLKMLNQFSQALAGTLDIDKLLHLALRQILQITQGEQGYVFFGEDEACRASLDRNGLPLSEIQVSRSVVARVVRDRKPLAILDVGQDEELQQKASLMIRNVRSVMCVPLLLDDHLVGLIYISSPTANKTFTRHDLDLMSAISAQVALALENAQAYETIKELNAGLEAKVKERTEDLERALRELTETQAQLVETEKLATVGTLAGGVAHEINNPLGAILTNAQLLKLDIDDPDQRDSLDLIEEGARRCKEIVSALLRYSREAQSNLQPVNLRVAVEDALAALDPRLREIGVTPSLELQDVPLVLGDLPEYRQVITHLVNNALDAVAEIDPQQACVALGLSHEPGSVSLTVTDNGHGMTPEVLKRIFDPFFTTKKVGSGTGLGLSVCQRIVEKYNGRLLVRSDPGEGSTFTLILPVPQAEASSSVGDRR